MLYQSFLVKNLPPSLQAYSILKSAVLTVLVSLLFMNISVANTQVNAKNIALEQQITPLSFIEPSYYVDSQSALNRRPNAGYNIENITAKVIKTRDDAFLLRVFNRTPRKFAEMALVIDGNGYLIAEAIEPFSYKIIGLRDIALSLASKVTILKPNSGFQPNVSLFGDNVAADADIKDSYHLIQSHLKTFYAQQSIMAQFKHMFFNKRRESLDDLYNKLHRTLTYNQPKGHLVFQNSSAGVASNNWLSLGWPLSIFLTNRENVLSYGVYSHEYAHTMGYGHSSGLAYGWDDNVTTGIARLMREGSIIPGEVVDESSSVYLHFDDDSHVLTAYAKNPHQLVLENINFIALKGSIEQLTVNDHEIHFGLNEILPNDSVFYVHADIRDLSNGLENKLATLVIRIANEKSEEPETLALNQWSRNYAELNNDNSSVYYRIPQQASVQHTDNVDVGWYASPASSVVVNAVHTETGNVYPLNISGRKAENLSITAGDTRGNGPVYFWVEPSNNNDLPSGNYTSSFAVEVVGWHDPSYRDALTVVVDYNHQKIPLINIHMRSNTEQETSINRVRNITTLIADQAIGSPHEELYFVVDSALIGPTEPRTRVIDGADEVHYSLLNVPVFDINYQPHTLYLRASKLLGSDEFNQEYPINTFSELESKPDIKLNLTYHSTDNTHLEGRYVTLGDKPLNLYVNNMSGTINERIAVNLDMLIPHQPNILPIVVIDAVDGKENEEILLDGSSSSDDGTIIRYHWQQAHGSHVKLHSPNEASTTFIANPVGKKGETLTFSLTVTDDRGGVSSTEKRVFIKNVKTEQELEQERQEQLQFLWFWFWFYYFWG